MNNMSHVAKKQSCACEGKCDDCKKKMMKKGKSKKGTWQDNPAKSY